MIKGIVSQNKGKVKSNMIFSLLNQKSIDKFKWYLYNKDVETHRRLPQNKNLTV